MSSAALCVLLLLASTLSAAGETASYGPLPLSADERLDLQVDPDLRYRITVSDPVPVVPSPSLPAGLVVLRSNNNLSIAMYEGRLFLAFRTSPIHFASPRARLIVLSSPDLGRSWTVETSISTGHDLREPFLLEVGGRLLLYFVELDERFYRFAALAQWRSARCGPGCWTAPESWGGPDEVTWDLKVRGGRAWMTSYRNKRYDTQMRPIDVRFQTSSDGLEWRDAGSGPVYRGGATETAFEFGRDGRLWGVTRNEDGDRTGFGSQVVSAEPDALADWRFPSRSDPSKFDSPRMFRHGRDIFLVARRQLGPAFGTRFPSVSGAPRKLLEWTSYSLGPKRTAIYRLDQVARRFETIVDLPSAGDTAFPSIVRLSPHELLIANYSSAFRHANRSWFWGQLNGTGIYFVRVRFDPVGAGAERPAVVDAAARVRDWAALGFGEEWPSPENHAGRLSGFVVASAMAYGVVRWRRRALAASRRSPAAAA
jgi:hypothetical protein